MSVQPNLDGSCQKSPLPSHLDEKPKMTATSTTLPPLPPSTSRTTMATAQSKRRNSNGTVRKLTRFCNEAENQWNVVPNRFDVTQREAEATWFTKEDYRRMRKNDERIIHTFLVQGCGGGGDDSYTTTNNNNNNTAVGDGGSGGGGGCTRGLEKRTPHASVMRKCHRLDVICAVLAEQERQRVHQHHHMASSFCVEAIAQACRTVSEEASREAMKWGALDAQIWDSRGKDPEEYHSNDSRHDHDDDGDCKQQPLVAALLMPSRHRQHRPPPPSSSSRNGRMQRLLGLGAPFRSGPR
jgi:hypothetical protein